MNYCYVEIPNDNNKILKYNHGERVIKSSVYDSCRLRMFSRKNAFLSKQPWKISHRKKNEACTFWLLIVSKLFIWWKKKKNLIVTKVKTIQFTVAAHGICNLRYKTPKEIIIVFHNGSTYDYHFIVNKLPKEFYGHLEYLFFLQRNILLFQ